MRSREASRHSPGAAGRHARRAAAVIRRSPDHFGQRPAGTAPAGTPPPAAAAWHGHYLAAFNLAPQGYLVTDAGGTIWEGNRAAAALLGVDRDDLPGRSLAAFVAAEDRASFREQLKRLRYGYVVKGFELILQPGAGPAVLVLLEVTAIHAADGRAVGLRWTARDLTLERRLEAGQARSNALLTALGHLVTRAQTTADANQIMEALGSELKQLSLHCCIALCEPVQPGLVVRYCSLDTQALAPPATQWAGLRIAAERFRLYDEVIERGRPAYVADWVALLAPLLPGIGQAALEQAGRLAGMTPMQRVVCLPLRVHETVAGMMGIWGESLEEQDVEALAIFAGQVAIALEHGRLFDESERQRAQLRNLSARLVTVLEEERRRIARELHDEAGQVLYGLRLQLDVLASRIPADHPDLRGQVKQIGDMMEDARQKIRRLSHALRPATLDELGLVPALRQLVAAFAREAGLVVVFRPVGLAGRLAPAVETACYRIVQEALTNVMRHAGAGRVGVYLRLAGDQIRLSVTDDGCGFDPRQIPAGGVGLVGIQERAAGLGGEVTIHSAAGQGTHLEVRLPATPAERQ